MFIFISQPAYSAITAEEIIAKIQKAYDSAEDYKAEFYQENMITSIKRVKKALGVAYFKKNGRMYWEYKEPEKQKFISNGKMVWLYQPEINQVQQFEFNSLNLSNTEKSFLDGIGSLISDFDAEYKGEEIEGNMVLILTPKGDGVGFKSMRMLINKETYKIVSTTTTDVYGNLNTITFRKVEFNTGISDDFFDFKVPEGVHIVTPPGAK